MKRYIYILIALVIIAAAIVFGLYLWKSGSFNLPGTATTGTGTTGSLPSTGTQGTTGINSGEGGAGATSTESQTSPTSSQIVAGSFGPLSNDPVLNYFVEPNNTILILEPNGVVATIANGQTSYISSSTASNVIAGSFSFDGKKALLSFGDPNNPQTSVFNVASATWMALPQGMLSPTWSPSDYRIAYLANVATGKEGLATIDTSNVKKTPLEITSLYVQDLSLQWIGKSQFVLSDRPSSEAVGSAIMFDASKQSFTLLAGPVAGIESVWSPTSQIATPEGLLSYALSTGGANTLALIDTSGNVLQDLAISTLPTKCGFATATTTVANATSSSNYLALYCGIPRDAASFAAAHLPDDYNQMALFTSDNIYRINTQTGNIETLWSDPNQNVDVSDLKTLGNEIFFIDRYTNKLYALTLQQ